MEGMIFWLHSLSCWGVKVWNLTKCHSRPSIVQWRSGQFIHEFSCFKCSLQYHHSVAQLVCTKLYYFLSILSFSSPIYLWCENHMASKWNRFASWSFSFLLCPSMFTISIWCWYFSLCNAKKLCSFLVLQSWAQSAAWESCKFAAFFHCNIFLKFT